MNNTTRHARSPVKYVPSPFDDAARSGIDLPMPGSGRTADRFAALRSWARTNGSLGRLTESHFDAIAILREAGRRPPEGLALAVWASESRGKLVAKRIGDVLHLVGTKAFCGGASLVDAALVTAMLDIGAGPTLPVLLMIDLREPGLRIDPNSWTPAAFTEAGVCTVDFDLELDPSCMIGAPGFYLDRAGFWQGAVGVAAVWAGLGDALIDCAEYRSADMIADAARGETLALRWGIDAALSHAAALIDAAPLRDARQIAIAARHVVATNLTEILRLLDHETGPGPIAFDPEWQQRRLELTMSVLQSHGRRDVIGLSPEHQW